MNPQYRILKEKAQYLKTQTNTGETIIWNTILKNKQMLGYQFLKQHVLDKYTVNFICRKAKLIIVIDEDSTNLKDENNVDRDNYLMNLGYKVLRFQEKEIQQNIQNIKRSIEQYLANLKL